MLSTPAKTFKIEQGELFPENMLQDASMVENGKVTDKGFSLLKEKLPHIDFSNFEKDRSAQVSSLAKLAGGKLGQN